MLVASITFALVAHLAPPARYDHEPRTPYVVTELAQSKIQRVCRSETHGAGDQVLGCSLPELGLIYVVKGMKPDVRQLIVRHEKAHLNGWVHGHQVASR